jgi:hypothetical protein
LVKLLRFLQDGACAGLLNRRNRHMLLVTAM